MNTENEKIRKGRVFLLPAAVAMPFIAALTVLMIRFGPTIRKMVGIIIKLAVTE